MDIKWHYYYQFRRQLLKAETRWPVRSSISLPKFKMYFVITEKKIIEFCNFCNLFELRSEFVTRGHPYKIFKRHCSCTARSSLFLSVLLIFGTVYLTYNLLNSSNKRACSNTFVHVTLVSSTHNNEQKLQENVKSDTRKLIKHLKKKI